MKTKTLKQTIIFKASPQDVYGMLMNSKKHAAFTSSKASISNKVGGKFSAYDGYIRGENMKLVEGKKIVQKWTTTEWPKGHYSTVTFTLTKTSTGTKMTFVHEGIPVENYDGIKQGWIDYYWNPMKEMLKK